MLLINELTSVSRETLTNDVGQYNFPAVPPGTYTVKAQLTGYKIPKIVEFWKELPKTNVGKVLRREVKNAPLQK